MSGGGIALPGHGRQDFGGSQAVAWASRFVGHDPGADGRSLAADGCRDRPAVADGLQQQHHGRTLVTRRTVQHFKQVVERLSSLASDGIHARTVDNMAV